MGFISHKVKQSEIKAGDHLYTWRAIYTFSHHGIYVGGDKIVHFTQNQLSDSSSDSSPFSSSSFNSSPFSCSSVNSSSSSSSSVNSSSSSSSSVNSRMFSSSSSVDSLTCLEFADCGFTKDGSGVVVSCLNCFIGTGSLYRYEYGVSVRRLAAQIRGGTCTMAEADPPETVVHRAMYLLHNGFFDYDLLTNNCEDFALYCKTGRLVRCKKWEAPMVSSGQATSFLSAVSTLPLKFFVSSPVVFAVSMAATYSLSRYATDIGVRDDVVEVRVEDINDGLFRKAARAGSI